MNNILTILILAIIVLKVLDIMSVRENKNKYDIQEINKNICKMMDDKKNKA